MRALRRQIPLGFSEHTLLRCSNWTWCLDDSATQNSEAGTSPAPDL